MLKGINILIIKYPLILKDFIIQLYEIYFKILNFVKPNTEENRNILGYVFIGIKELLIKYPECNALIDDKAEFLLNKTLENELDER